MHGYGATTFGRLARGAAGLPAILHEHANLTDTPWFQKIADRHWRRTPIWRSRCRESTAEFMTRARLIPADRTHVVYLGVPLEEFSRPRSARRDRAARASAGHAGRRAARSARSRG